MAELPDSILDRVEHLIQAGNNREARVLLVELIKNNPTSAPAWWALSKVVVEEKQVIDCLERTLRYDPSHENARLRLEQIMSPPKVEETGIPPAVMAEEPETVTATVNEPLEEAAEPVPVDSSVVTPSDEEISAGTVSTESAELPSEPVLLKLLSTETSPGSSDTPVREIDFYPGDSPDTGEEFDAFAPDAFEKYNTGNAETISPSEAARPWVEELLQTLHGAEESEPAPAQAEEVPAWAAVDPVPASTEAHGMQEQSKKARMSTVEIILLIILVLLVLFVGGYFGLSLLGVI